MPERPRFPSLIDDIIRQQDQRMRERVLESVEGLLPAPFPGFESEGERVEDIIRRAGRPLPYREAVEAVDRARFLRNSPIVDVRAQIPAVSVNHDLSSAEISRLSSRERGGGRRADNAGLTRALLGMRMTTSPATGPAVNGRIPYWVTNVTVTPLFRSITVYIAAGYAAGSCEYRETRAHEDEHVRVDRELLEQYAGRLRAALVFSHIPTQETPLSAASAEEGEQRTETLLRGTLQPVYDELRRRLHEANNDLDTPANYAQVHARCRNW
ncbi:MAG: hypothetical protein ACREAM_31100 [Blastocatellia bacterium]